MGSKKKKTKKERNRTKGNTNFRFGKTGKRKGKWKLLRRKRVKILKVNPPQKLFSSICREELCT